MSARVRVLIVDDSAYVRKMVRQMLSSSPFLEVVGAARDGTEALEMVERLQPDVVTLDLNMPNLDGLEFLKLQMANRSLPVVLLSSASENGKQVMQALEAGAVDVVQKPTALATAQVLDVAEDLIAKVRSAATAKVRQPPQTTKAVNVISAQQKFSTDLVVIGVSTGGPQALRYIIPSLPSDFPVPIALVLHMPLGFTESFAQSLDAASQLTVVEAKEGDIVRKGMVFVAPAGYHLIFNRQANGAVLTRIDLHPTDTPHRPAVDVLFQSAAQVYGDRVLAIVLTGMGSDGTLGAAWIKAQGGRVFSEAEESCVVYGMPRSVVEAGLSDASIPLSKMAQAICEAL